MIKKQYLNKLSIWYVQPQVEQSQYNGGGYYGYGQGYETYGYAPVAQDPTTMYYGGYAGYGGYPQVQQPSQPQPQQHQVWKFNIYIYFYIVKICNYNVGAVICMCVLKSEARIVGKWTRIECRSYTTMLSTRGWAEQICVFWICFELFVTFQPFFWTMFY